jgi:short-subunit dehydrogenase
MPESVCWAAPRSPQSDRFRPCHARDQRHVAVDAPARTRTHHQYQLGAWPFTAPYSVHYSATKHALEGYSESLEHEIRAFNIRVSLIEPAYTRSVFEQNALEPDPVLKEYDQARAGARALVRDVMTTADPPQVAADAVLQAATAARPRRRYTAGKITRQVSVLRRFAPAEMFDKSLRKQMRLPA